MRSLVRLSFEGATFTESVEHEWCCYNAFVSEIQSEYRVLDKSLVLDVQSAQTHGTYVLRLCLEINVCVREVDAQAFAYRSGYKPQIAVAVAVGEAMLY